MDYRVYVREAVDEELEQVVDYLSQNNPQHAREIYQEVRAGIESLQEYARRAPVYKEPHRVMTLRNKYRIFYKVHDLHREVEVMHIFAPGQNKP